MDPCRQENFPYCYKVKGGVYDVEESDKYIELEKKVHSMYPGGASSRSRPPGSLALERYVQAPAPRGAVGGSCTCWEPVFIN